MMTKNGYRAINTVIFQYEKHDAGLRQLNLRKKY